MIYSYLGILDLSGSQIFVHALSKVLRTLSRVGQGQNYFHKNNKACFAFLIVLTFAMTMQMVKKTGALTQSQAVAPNCIRSSTPYIIHCHTLAEKTFQLRVSSKEQLKNVMSLNLTPWVHVFLIVWGRKGECISISAKY